VAPNRAVKDPISVIILSASGAYSNRGEARIIRNTPADYNRVIFKIPSHKIVNSTLIKYYFYKILSL